MIGHVVWVSATFICSPLLKMLQISFIRAIMFRTFSHSYGINFEHLIYIYIGQKQPRWWRRKATNIQYHPTKRSGIVIKLIEIPSSGKLFELENLLAKQIKLNFYSLSLAMVRSSFCFFFLFPVGLFLLCGCVVGMCAAWGRGGLSSMQ